MHSPILPKSKASVMMLVVKGGLVIPDAKGKPDYANVFVDSEGKIIDILARQSDVPEGAETIDATGKIVMPGLVNAHTHSYANFTRALAENYPLEEMMLHFAAQRAFQTPEIAYYNALSGAIEMLKGGVTACLDMLSQPAEGLDAAMRAYEEIGFRTTVLPNCSDKTYYQTLPVLEKFIPAWEKTKTAKSAPALIEMSVAFLKKWHGRHGRLYAGFAPSTPLRCSEELLVKSMRLAMEYDTVYHTHVLETQRQRSTAHLFYGMPMLSYLDKIGCLNGHLSMAHGVWLSAEEAILARDRGAMMAHCPTSNLYLGCGIAPVNDWRKIGLPLAVGTDGPNSSGNQNLFEAMRLAALLHKVSEPDRRKWISAAEAFDMATMGGARLLRQENRIGSLAPGKEADIVILDPSRSGALKPLQNVVSQIVYGESGAAVDAVLVKGEVVLKDGKCTKVDEDAVRSKADELGGRLIEKIRAEFPRITHEIAYLESILPRLG